MRSFEKFEIEELVEKLDAANVASQSSEQEALILEQEKTHLEQKYLFEFKRFEEAQERCKNAEKDAERATQLADKARAEAVAAQKEKNDVQRVAMERLTQIERHVESLERQKVHLIEEVEGVRASQMDALSKVSLLEARVEEREKEIESLLQSNNEQRTSTVQVLESFLEAERAARAEANNRAVALSFQLQSTQGKLDLLQQELTSVRLNETALDSKLKTASHGKRSRVDDYDDVGLESIQDMDVDGGIIRGRKRFKSTTQAEEGVSAFKGDETALDSKLRTASHGKRSRVDDYEVGLESIQDMDVDDGIMRGRKRFKSTTQAEEGVSASKGDEDNNNHCQQTKLEDHTRFTVLKLKQELTKHGFGAELLKLRNPNKKDILALYEIHILQK